MSCNRSIEAKPSRKHVDTARENDGTEGRSWTGNNDTADKLMLKYETK